MYRLLFGTRPAVEARMAKAAALTRSSFAVPMGTFTTDLPAHREPRTNAVANTIWRVVPTTVVNQQYASMTTTVARTPGAMNVLKPPH